MELESSLAGRSSKTYRGRLLAALWLTALAFVGLASRLYSLQILRGDELSSKGEKNYVQRVEVHHDRGIIFDAHGRILVDNRPALDVEVIPTFLGKKDEAGRTLERLAGHVGMTPEELERVRQTIREKRGLDRFVPIVVKTDLEPEQVEAVEADKAAFQLDGVNIVEGRRRTYRHATLAAHLLGYVNEIDPARLKEEIAKGNAELYERGDLIGRSGVEHTYESELRGVDGYEKVVVDAKGRRMHGDYVDQLLGDDRVVAPEPGHNLFLTIDLDLQERAQAAFSGRAGAIVALDPNDGAVLAIASFPAYDPNLVAGALAAEEKARLDSDPLKPWLNRSIQGQYAPGSTFKVSTALAALMERATSTSDKVHCPGYFRMGRQTWRCHKDTGHGVMDLKDAIKYSCDTFFYTMAGRIGIEPIAKASRLLGLGRPTGIPIPGEKAGLVPDEAFHNRVDKATGGYTRGMAVNSAIGQGSVLVTPLQLAVAYATIANGGTVYAPQVVRRIETADFRVVRRFVAEEAGAVREEVRGDAPALLDELAPEPASQLGVPPEWLAAIRAGLFAVTSEPGGTAYWKRSKMVSMGGKTGTAQVIRLGRERFDADEMQYEERDHAWFVAYAPAEAPEIVVAVVNEHSGHGGSAAAPIATAVIDAFFELKNQRLAAATEHAP